MATPRPSMLRREPVQARSARRVEAMLDACAAILDEHGYDGLTTTLVAERAGVAIGSVYQFFPDKRALALALCERHLHDYLDRVRTALREGEFTDWWPAVEVTIDIYLDMHRTVPGFTAVRFGADLEPDGPHSEKETTRAVAHSINELLVEAVDIPQPANLEFVMTNATEVSNAILTLAFRRDPEGDPATVADAKWMLRAYIGHHMPD